MREPKLKGKSYDIPKRLVWDAWLKVKENGGAAGPDGVSIEQFGEDLSRNLYRLWNVRNECGEKVICRCLPDRGIALREMGDCWPSGIVLWGMVSNHHVLRWLKTVVVSDVEKASLRRQVGIRETTAVRSVENFKDGTRTGLGSRTRDGVWRVPMYWPGGVRHRGGVNLICGSRRERWKADADIVSVWLAGAIGSPPSGRNREGLSTVAAPAGGPSRSSGDAPVMGVEPRGRLVRGWFGWPTGRWSGGAR